MDMDGFDSDAQDRHSGLAGARFLGRARGAFTSRASAPSARTDIEFAGKLGYTIKLLGVVKSRSTGAGKAAKRASAIQVSVYPALVPNGHVLASVNHVFNAVFVRGDVVGDTLFYGRGAGKDATASAVLSDIADAALDLKHGTREPRAAVCAARPRRQGAADRRGGLALLSAVECGGQAGHAGQNRGHSGRVARSASPRSSSPKGTKARACR